MLYDRLSLFRLKIMQEDTMSFDCTELINEARAQHERNTLHLEYDYPENFSLDLLKASNTLIEELTGALMFSENSRIFYREIVKENKFTL